MAKTEISWEKPLVVAICGVKNSGKTTCMEGLVSDLSRQGYRVAAIKHDGHDFQADVPGTDSFRMQQAGAYGTAVFSDNRVLVYKETETDLAALVDCFPESDLILVEGQKEKPILKFEIVRQGISDRPVSNPTGRLGILTDIPRLLTETEGALNLNDRKKLAEKLVDMIERKRKGEKIWVR